MKKRVCCAFLLLAAVLYFCGPAYAVESFKFYRVTPGDQTYAIKQSTVNNYVLVASTNTSVTVPSNAVYAVFASTADIWVRIGGAASVPSVDVTDGTGSELNPIVRRVEPGSTIGVISEYAAKVSIVFYK